MAKQMARRKKARRRNASSGASGGSRPRDGTRQRGGGGPRGKNNNAIKNVAVAVGGGALGALAAGIAVGAGVTPQTAAVATLAGGALGAYALKGPAKVAAIGAACAASGQLALAWQVKRQTEAAVVTQAKRKDALGAQPTPPALPAPAAAAPAPAAPKRNGYDDLDDEDDDPRNAGEVEEYGYAEEGYFPAS